MSERARALAEVRQAALATPEVRPDRVEEIRRRAARGMVIPDADKIARAIIASGIL